MQHDPNWWRYPPGTPIARLLGFLRSRWNYKTYWRWAAWRAVEDAWERSNGGVGLVLPTIFGGLWDGLAGGFAVLGMLFTAMWVWSLSRPIRRWRSRVEWMGSGSFIVNLESRRNQFVTAMGCRVKGPAGFWQEWGDARGPSWPVPAGESTFWQHQQPKADPPEIPDGEYGVALTVIDDAGVLTRIRDSFLISDGTMLDRKAR